MAARKSSAARQPAQRGLVITRVFDAPRSLVFKAWTEREHLKEWWGQPKGATMPYCKVDLRVGGTLHYRVNLPDGNVIWGKGVYREIVEPERLVFTDCFSDEHGNIVEPPPGHPKESVITATFTERDGKTTVVVEHAGVERASKENQDAYRQGWGECLDRLAEDLTRARLATTGEALVMAEGRSMPEMVLTRFFDAPRELVWRAWTEREQVVQWWGPKGYTLPGCEMDFRTGGAYRFVMRGPDGEDNPFHGVYREIVRNERIVFTALLDKLPGHELVTTVTFAEEGGKTKLTVRQTTPPGDAGRGQNQGWSETLERLADLLAEETKHGRGK